MAFRTNPLTPFNAAIALLLASVAVLGSALLSQYWGGLEPCQLCLYQRWPYALVIALAASALLPLPRGARIGLIALSGLIFLAGAGIAGFHVGVEQKWWEGLPGCSAPGIGEGLSLEDLKSAILSREKVVPCDEVAWSLFGVSMAGYNFLVSLFLGAAALWAALSLKRESQAP